MVKSINYNGGKQVSYQYNKTGDLVEMQDWTGTTSFELDLLHRITATNDHKGNRVEYGYDEVGNQISVKYPDSTAATKTYDLVGNLKTVTEADGRTTEYAYDGMKRVTHMDYPDGWQEDYTYDAMGQNTSILDTDPTGKDMKQQKNKFDYDVCGNMTYEYMRGNGTGEATTEVFYTYDALHRVTKAKENYGNASRTYQYDSLGNLTWEQNSNNVTVDYKLNNLNQITSKSEDGWKTATTFTYDGRGNLVLEQYGKNKKLTTIGAYTYDETNKMVKGVNANAESSSYLYNGLDALVQNTWVIAKNGYGYHDVDADTAAVAAPMAAAAKGNNGKGNSDKPTGSDVKKTSTVVKDFVVDYTVDTMDPLMEYETNGLTYRYVYGNERLSVNITGIENGAGKLIENGNQVRLYYHQDLRGTVDYLTSPMSGKVESWTHYNEWGEITHNAIVKLEQRELDLVKNYTGHEYDAVLDEYYAKARMYDAANRRFTSVDPILDGTRYDLTSYLQNPMQLVQYTYVLDNPLIWVDLLGLDKIRNPYLGHVIDISAPIYMHVRGTAYYALDLMSQAISGGTPVYNSDSIEVAVVSTDGYTNTPLTMKIDTSGAQDGKLISDSKIKIYNYNTGNEVTRPKPSILYKDKKYYISTSGAMSLINNKNYFRRISCDGDTMFFDTRTYEHYTLANYAAKYANIKFEPWTTAKAAYWKTIGGAKYLNEYKISWIESFKDVINDAAKKYGVPAFEIARVAFVEVGGDPLFFDPAAYAIRNTLHKDENDSEVYNKDPLKTSFGYLSMQVRRAGETLGYSTPLAQGQIDTLIDTLNDPVQSVYLVASHLSDLREIDFKDTPVEDMTSEQWAVTVERYNRGPDVSYDSIKNNHGYADRILPYKDRILKILKG